MHPDLASLVRVASTPEAFLSAIESALAEPAKESEHRLQAARRHTWTARADQAASVLERFFPED
jgi:hypothetical protein